MLLKIIQDETAENPRENRDCFGTMVCFHDKYELGDAHNFTVAEVSRIENSDKFICLPLYLYEHSIVTMATKPFDCPWDSGKVGLIFVNKQEAFNQYSKTKSKTQKTLAIKAALQAEVQEYDYYLRNEVYGYVLYDSNNNVINSCWQFYGNDPKINGIRDSVGHSNYDNANVVFQYT